jgi:hypothetical protein
VQQNREEMEVLFALLPPRYGRGSVILELNLASYRLEASKKGKESKS